MIRFLFALIMITSPAAARTYTVAPQSVCDVVVAHVPAEDVNIGADLSGGMDVVSIPVEVDLVQQFGLAVPAGVELKPTVAAIDIHQDGRVFYDGTDISDPFLEQCGAEVLEGIIPPPPKKESIENE